MAAQGGEKGKDLAGVLAMLSDEQKRCLATALGL